MNTAAVVLTMTTTITTTEGREEEATAEEAEEEGEQEEVRSPISKRNMRATHMTKSSSKRRLCTPEAPIHEAAGCPVLLLGARGDPTSEWISERASLCALRCLTTQV